MKWEIILLIMKIGYLNFLTKLMVKNYVFTNPLITILNFK